MTSLTMSKRRVVALVAAGVVAGAVAGVAISELGVATAANGGSSPTPVPVAPGMPFGGGMVGGPMALGALGGRVLHGEATIAKPGGGTMVVRMQTGRITAVGRSTVTVRSSDGYVATYTVDSGTRIVLNGAAGALSSLKSGDLVRTFGVVSGSTVQAKAVLDGVPVDVRSWAQRWRHAMRHDFPLRRAG